MATLDDLLSQLSENLSEVKSRSQDIRSLAASDAPLSELMTTANLIAQARLKFADTVEEMIRARDLPMTAIKTYTDKLNDRLMEFTSNVSNINARILDLAGTLRADEPAFTAIRNQLEKAEKEINEKGPLLDELSEAQVTEYVKAQTDFLDSIERSSKARDLLLNQEKERLTKQQDELLEEVVNTEARLQSEVSSATFQDLIDTIDNVASVTIDAAKLASGDKTELDNIAANRRAILDSLSDRQKQQFLSVVDRAEKIDQAITAVVEIGADIDVITRTPQDAIKKLTSQKRQDLEETRAKQKKARLVKMEAELASISGKLENEFTKSDKDLLQLSKSLGNVFGNVDSGASKVTSLGISLIRLGVSAKDGVSVFRSLGESLKKMMDPMESLRNMGDFFFTRLLPISGMLKLSEEMASLNRDTGGLATNIRQIADESGAFNGTNQILNQFNGTAKEYMDSISGLSKGIPGFLSTFSNDTIKRMAGLTAELKRLGVAAETVSKIQLQLQGFTGKDSKLIDDQIRKMGEFGLALKIGANTAIETFAKVTKEFAGFYKDATTAAQTFIAISESTGVAVDSLINITKKFDTFEDAAKMVSTLNFALGNFNLDIIQLQRMKPEEKLLSLIDAIKASGKTLDDFDPYMQRFIASQMGINDVAEAANLFKGNMSDVFNLMEKGRERQKTLEEAAKVSASLTDRFNTMLVKFSPMINKILDLAEGFMTIIEYMSPAAVFFGILTAKAFSFGIQLSLTSARIKLLQSDLVRAGEAGSASFAGLANNIGKLSTMMKYAGGIAAIATVGYLIYDNFINKKTTTSTTGIPEAMNVNENTIPTAEDFLTIRGTDGRIKQTMKISPNDNILGFKEGTATGNFLTNVLGITNNTASSLENMGGASSFASSVFGGSSSALAFNNAITNGVGGNSTTATVVASTANITREATERSNAITANYVERQQAVTNKQVEVFTQIRDSQKELVTSMKEKTELPQNINLVATLNTNFTKLQESIITKTTAEVDRRLYGSAVVPA